MLKGSRVGNKWRIFVCCGKCWGFMLFNGKCWRLMDNNSVGRVTAGFNGEYLVFNPKYC